MAHGLRTTGGGQANIVDEDVQSAMLVDGGGDESFDFVWLSDVASKNVDRSFGTLVQETLLRSFGGRQVKVAA